MAICLMGETLTLANTDTAGATHNLCHAGGQSVAGEGLLI